MDNCERAYTHCRVFRLSFDLEEIDSVGEAKMPSFDFGFFPEDCRPRRHLPIGTALMGSIVAASVVSMIVSLIAMG
jgi:hypothetical protein